MAESLNRDDEEARLRLLMDYHHSNVASVKRQRDIWQERLEAAEWDRKETAEKLRKLTLKEE